MRTVRQPIDRDDAYIAAARRDPAVRRANEQALTSLGFRLWDMTRGEKAAVTVAVAREKFRGLLHGYVTDAEIQAVIDREQNRQWIDALTGLPVPA
jgi:hypothetical protein